jgi:ribosome recycling factor
MSDDLELILEDAQDSMQKAISHLESELIKIRAGKANPQMLDGLTVDYYGIRCKNPHHPTLGKKYASAN